MHSKGGGSGLLLGAQLRAKVSLVPAEHIQIHTASTLPFGSVLPPHRPPLLLKLERVQDCEEGGYQKQLNLH